MLNREGCAFRPIFPGFPLQSQSFFNLFFVLNVNSISFHHEHCHDALCPTPWMLSFVKLAILGAHICSPFRVGDSFLKLDQAGRPAISCSRSTYRVWTRIASRLGLLLWLESAQTDPDTGVEYYQFSIYEFGVLDYASIWIPASRGLCEVSSMEVGGQFYVGIQSYPEERSRMCDLIGQLGGNNPVDNLLRYAILACSTTELDNFFIRNRSRLLCTCRAFFYLALGNNEDESPDDDISALESILGSCFTDLYEDNTDLDDNTIEDYDEIHDDLPSPPPSPNGDNEHNAFNLEALLLALANE